ncbi:hypothetical protein [Vibrio fluvialis]|uniref:hypothetical protein n=1 Tax=Vibrio fluvialis TaxID=676 RepID=UPI002DD44771|nr:hypothetical protein [Vibrio fluvialis]
MAFWNRKPQQQQRYVAPATDSLLDEREDEAEQGLSNQQLLSALNAAQTALMMIDRDFKITYLNKQSMNLLKHHEALFKSVCVAQFSRRRAVPHGLQHRQFSCSSCTSTADAVDSR